MGAFNRADFDTLKSLFAADATVQGVLRAGGMDVVIANWRELHAAFANELTIVEMMAAGSRVAVRLSSAEHFVANSVVTCPRARHSRSWPWNGSESATARSNNAGGRAISPPSPVKSACR